MKASGGMWPLFGLMEKTVCHRTKTKPSVTGIRQMAAGLCRARQRSTLVDQLGLTSTTTSGTRWFSFFSSLCALCIAVTLPCLSPSLSVLHIFLILSVNPTLSLSLFLCHSHYSKHILLISPLSLLTTSQNKDKVVIHLLHHCQQIAPK